MASMRSSVEVSLTPDFKGEKPDDVHQRSDAAELEVQFVLVLAVLLHDEGPEEPERRPVLRVAAAIWARNTFCPSGSSSGYSRSSTPRDSSP